MSQAILSALAPTSIKLGLVKSIATDNGKEFWLYITSSQRGNAASPPTSLHILYSAWEKGTTRTPQQRRSLLYPKKHLPPTTSSAKYPSHRKQNQSFCPEKSSAIYLRSNICFLSSIQSKTFSIFALIF